MICTISRFYIKIIECRHCRLGIIGNDQVLGRCIIISSSMHWHGSSVDYCESVTLFITVIIIDLIEENESIMSLNSRL